jgi:hypothetical protein
MHLRRNIALTAGALVLAAPVLSSCGFNYATDRTNTNAAGVNSHAKTVDVLGAVIVAAHPNSGTFIATLSNNMMTEPATLTDLTGAEGNTLTAQSFDPIEIPPGGAVNLATVGGPRVDGTFEAGQFLPVTLTFDSGETVVMDIPVVAACDEYAGLDAAPTASATSTTGAATPSAEASTYSCDTLESSVGH